jgi:phosphoribosylformylglycinamidine cyclo-ligase
MSDKYNRRGVSASKEDVHAAIKGLDKGIFPNAFCKILPDFFENNPEQCLIMHADGAGTKSALAYLVWKETGDLSVFKGIAQDALVMNTDDLMCCGALGPFVFSSAIARNKLRIPGEVIREVIQGTREFIEMLNQWGVPSTLAGGETADTGDLVQTIIVDSTIVCRFPKKQVIALDQLAPGQVIVGFESDGLAKWESDYNAGMGSNGLTSARHDIFSGSYKKKYPETFDKQLPEEVVYAGSALVSDLLGYDHPYAGKGSVSVGKAVLSPTRTYLPLAVQMIREFGPQIKGMIHCSGGGQTKILHFLPPEIHVIKEDMFPINPLFSLIQKQSQTPLHEMYRVFNMGHRLEVIVDEKIADHLVALGKENHVQAKIIGSLSTGQEHRLVICSQGEKLTYN